jgi:NaMN:DMB phosphoribosyltransferase
MIKQLPTAVAAALCLFLTGANAQDSNSAEPPLDEEVRAELDEATLRALEAAQHVLTALAIFIERMPTYAAPEVLENGDIIIRRLPSSTESSVDPNVDDKT